MYLRNLEEYFPKSSEVRLYFKTVDGRRPKPSEIEKGIPNGWVLHEIYYKNLIMVEIYQNPKLSTNSKKINCWIIKNQNHFG